MEPYFVANTSPLLILDSFVTISHYLGILFSHVVSRR
jgi:hypothetical protein